MHDLTKLTLGQLLTSDDATVQRNAMSILKTLQRCDHAGDRENGKCIYCFKPVPHHDLCQQCGWMPHDNKCVNPDCAESTII